MAKKDVFIAKDFLLATKTAQKLYHDFAADLPIIDYHGHLPPPIGCAWTGQGL